MIAAVPRLSPGGRAWLWVLVAALAWTMQVIGPPAPHAEAHASEREVVATERFSVEEISRKAGRLLRRPARRAAPRPRTPASSVPAARPCARTAELQTLLCVWRT
ncbi:MULTISPECIES: hypothetical protein [Nonomuraea]|uniref:Uncharacterized protein n=1 Tax=Nonomuraea mangrovi TaxID=2316207 RepID=A0ABW4T9J4_9ACTN